MKRLNLSKQIAAISLVWVMLMLPMVILAQTGGTRIEMPKNKYDIRDDVKIGNEYSAKVDQEFPILNDREATQYVADVGRRLVNSIPREFQHREFNYRFKVVNASDINAFALPGGPMYVNRGMIEAAKNEGEMAGVMAHEISHVALRHGTAQATKQTSLKSQILGIGAILGGAILGGEAGAAIGQTVFAAYQTKYSREYESQADILGARIMADAGYDPRDLANMFQTISQQSGGSRAPEFLSSHPNPENRYRDINREAQLLRVSNNPIKYTREFARIREKFQSMPKAPSMAEIEKNSQNNPNSNTGANSEMTRGRYSRSVPTPSTRTRTYQGGELFRVEIPSNWQQFPGQRDIWFAPEGAYGNQGITHGATIGLYQTQQRSLDRATDEYVKGILQSNSYLRQTTNYSRFNLDGRAAYATQLSGRSPVTGQTEYAIIYTTQLRDGSLMYLIGVAPTRDSSRYNRAFNDMVRSLQISRQA